MPPKPGPARPPDVTSAESGAASSGVVETSATPERATFRTWLVPVAVVVALVVAFVLGRMGSVDPTKSILAAAGTVFVVLVVGNPRWIVHALIVVTFAARPESLVDNINVAGFKVHYFEIFLVFALGYVGYLLYRNPEIRRAISRTAGARAATFFAIVLVFGVLFGFGKGHSFDDVQTDIRTLGDMFVAIVVASAIVALGDGYRYVKTILAVLWGSAAMTAFSSAAGSPLGVRTETAQLYGSDGAIGEGSDAVRYLTEATPLALATLLVCAALVAIGRGNTLLICLAALPSVVISMLGFSRNEPITLAASLGFVLAVTTFTGHFLHTARRTAAMLVIAIGLFAAVLFVANFTGEGTWLDTQVGGYTERVVGGLDGSKLAVDQSARDRLDENNYVFKAVDGHEITGLGLGARYKPPLGQAYDFSAHGGRLYAHNFYLWVYVKLGLIGLAAFVAMVGAALGPVLNARRVSTYVWVGSAALFGLSVTISVAPLPLTEGSSVVYAGVFGLCIGGAVLQNMVKGERPSSIAGDR